MTDVLERTLSCPGGQGHVLDALRWPQEADDAVRLFLGQGARSADVRPNGAGRALRITTAKALSGTLMLSGEIAAGSDIVLDFAAGGSQTVVATAPEWDLFEGLHAAFVQRNGEDLAIVLDWLRYHAVYHEVQAVLILDRARPGRTCFEALRAALTATPIPGLQRVVVFSASMPLGRPDAPPESHPVHAPDAPGKDRMTLPAADPWSSPLGELGMFEVMRWRFLALARAVVGLEMTDLLAPDPGPSVLRRVREVESGVLSLLGRRVYPWRVRKKARPGFGDHICGQFDHDGGNRRWVVAPDLIPDAEPWRLVRIGSREPDPDDVGAFYRCVALRSPEAAPSELVPKSSLVLDDALLQLAREVFGADPVLPPVAAPGAKIVLPANLPGRTAIVTCMKNEGPFILEWIAYHRAIGVDDFLIYTNDCTDGTDALLTLLQSHGIVEHRDNPYRQSDLRPQHAALEAAEAEPVMQRAGWGICMDVDEFLNIHTGDGTLRALYGAVGNANMISCTWRLFGNADLHHFEDSPTIARFTACAPELIRKPHQAWGFKTLFRAIGIFRKLGVHRPKGLRPALWEQIDWVNGSGQPMPRAMLRNGWRSTLDSYGYDLVTLNHYAVRDAESFLVKRDRGRVNHVERDQGLGYWFRMNNNVETDTSIQRMLPAMQKELEALRALDGVAEQHAACVAAHRARITELRGAEAFAAFYAEITCPRLERLSRMHTHFGANVFLAGPDCVPDAVLERDHPPDYFFTVEPVDDTVH
jgi:hypothetical protein